MLCSVMAVIKRLFQGQSEQFLDDAKTIAIV